MVKPMLCVILLVLFVSCFKRICEGDAYKKIDSSSFGFITIVDQLPQYNGNIADALKLSIDQQFKDSVGSVIVSYWVNKKGETTKHQINKSTNKSLNNEAVRIMKKLHYDIPAMQKGKPVDCMMIQRIDFGQ